MKKTDIIAQVAEIELVYKPKIRLTDLPKISGSTDPYPIFLQYWDMDKIDLIEQFKVMLLNRGSRVLGIVDIASGGINSTTVDPRLIFAAALRAGAGNIILAHNHPSGSTKPSESDVKLTQEIIVAGRLLKIKVLDHLIVTKDGYYSMADEGDM